MTSQPGLSNQTTCEQKWATFFTKGQDSPWLLTPTNLDPLETAAFKAGQMTAREPEKVSFDPTVRWVTSRQLDDDIKVLAGKLPWPCVVAGIPRSGMIVAARLATHMGVPLFTVESDPYDGTPFITPTQGGRRCYGMYHLLNDIVVVDDSVNTGWSFESLRKRFPSSTQFAAVYVNPAQKHLVDYYVHLWPMHHLFEWHFFGSNLVEDAAFDMDGLICEDCQPDCDDDGPKYAEFLANAKPLWVPRPHTIPLIVTSRLQKYEHQTRAWLEEHGVTVEQIIFHPAATIAERDADFNPGTHKGLPFRTSRCKWFFESCPKQARIVSYWSHKPVICPVTGEVFQGT